MNLLIISLDSLREDHVSRSGSAVRTPRFDAASASFFYSDRCFSVSSATRPVHLSVFSGLYPFEHGIESQRGAGQRPDTPLLFRTLVSAGYTVAAYSEAPSVFTGLDLGTPVRLLPDPAGAGLDQLIPRLRPAPHERVCLFAHYWQAHTPYGAADGLAMGETLALLRAGRLDLVRQRYATAVTRLLEDKIAPLLESCDLERWTVLIFGDHGESWDAEEPYHGETLRNPVLRVPLYLHVPFSGIDAPDRALVSLIDVYPTVCGILQLSPGGHSFGRDWLADSASEPVYLAQITPSASAPSLASPGVVDPDLAPGASEPDAAARRWAVLNRDWKYRWSDGEAGKGVLEGTLSGCVEAAAPQDPRVDHLLRHWKSLMETSPYAGEPLADQTVVDQELLDQRLRDLGYL